MGNALLFQTVRPVANRLFQTSYALGLTLAVTGNPQIQFEPLFAEGIAKSGFSDETPEFPLFCIQYRGRTSHAVNVQSPDIKCPMPKSRAAPASTLNRA